MARTKTSYTAFRPTTAYEAQKAFLSQIILDAVLAVNGKRSAGSKEKIECRRFLQSERCHNWLVILDIEPDAINKVL